MDIAVLTFPGHTFQTTLSIQSIINLHQPAQLYVLVDDFASKSWTTYTEDLKSWLDSCFPNLKLIYKHYSELNLQDCESGWWRAQLVKLYSDTLIDNTEWLLVDGDIVFDRLINLKGVTPYTMRTPGLSSPIANLHLNYVKRLLNIDQGHLTVRGQYVATSPVPFRVLDRELLQGLRARVESQHNGDFLDLHLKWFKDQSIIGFEDPPTRMVMSEWELIECYRHYLTDTDWKMLELGSGYEIDKDTTGIHDPVLYKHSYKRDLDIGRDWFTSQGFAIPDKLWESSKSWLETHERHAK